MRSGEDLQNPAVVKVVADQQGRALYFSRAPIPLVRDDPGRSAVEGLHYIHLGVYIYTRDTLLRLAALPTGLLEEAEKLEQLRALDHGISIRVWETKQDSVRIDTPTDAASGSDLVQRLALTKQLVVERRIAVLFTEHSMDVVFAYADRLIVLARGRLIAEGTPLAIRDHPKVQEVYFGSGKTFESQKALA